MGVALRASADILLFAPNNRRLVTGDQDRGRLQVWDLEAAAGAKFGVELRVTEKVVKEVVIGPDGRWMVTRDADNIARLWDLGETKKAR